MEKAIVFSDLHVHNYKQHNENGRRLKNGVAFLDYIFKLAHANEIKILLMPGDLFNNMQIMATKAVNAVAVCLKTNFDKYPDIELIAVSGNHDQASVNLIDNPAESALEYLQAIFPQFSLFGHEWGCRASGRYRIWGIPYFEHKEHFRLALEKVNKRIADEDPVGSTVREEVEQIIIPYNILLMHQIVGSGLPIEDDIEPTDPLFDKFDLVLNGHIHHGEQLTDKFINVGSPMARDRGDIGKAKGFWIVDLDDPQATIAFKDISDKYPKFVEKTIGDELTEEDKKNYIVWVPAPIADNVKDAEVSKKFSTNLAPAEIVENYCKEVLSTEEVKDKLAYGLTLL